MRKKKDTPVRFSAVPNIFGSSGPHRRCILVFWASLALSPTRNEKKKPKILSVKNGLNRTISKGSNPVLGTGSFLYGVRALVPKGPGARKPAVERGSPIAGRFLFNRWLSCSRAFRKKENRRLGFECGMGGKVGIDRFI